MLYLVSQCISPDVCQNMLMRLQPRAGEAAAAPLAGESPVSSSC